MRKSAVIKKQIAKILSKGAIGDRRIVFRAWTGKENYEKNNTQMVLGVGF